MAINYWSVVATGRVFFTRENEETDAHFAYRLNADSYQLETLLQERTAYAANEGSYRITNVKVTFYPGSLWYDIALTGVTTWGANRFRAAAMAHLRILLVEELGDFVRNHLPDGPTGSLAAVTIQKWDAFCDDTRKIKDDYFYKVVVPMLLVTIGVGIGVAMGISMLPLLTKALGG